MKTVRMFLVRHGTTVLSAEDRFAGSSDVELSDDGRRQARQLAERLAGERLAAVYASPLRRAIETGAIVGRAHDLEPVARDGLREIDHGRWERLRRGEVEQMFPEEYAAWEADPFTFAPVGGESGLAVMARALPALHEIVRRHAGERVLVVSHKATIRLMLSNVLGFDARGYRDRLDQLPCCLNIIDFKGPVHGRLMAFNDVSHYAVVPGRADARLSRLWDSPQGE